MGENTFDLEVHAPYSAINKHHFVINRVLPAASVAFNGPIGAAHNRGAAAAGW